MPAAAVGLMSAAVLNLNNMRDIESDELSGKKTLALRLGFKNAMLYQMFLLQVPLILILVKRTNIIVLLLLRQPEFQRSILRLR